MSPPGDLTAWRELVEGDHADLIAEAAAAGAGDVRAIAALRKRYPAALVTVAIELAAARRKAAAKWPEAADRLVADVAGIEMATPAVIAHHKARHLSQASGPVYDLCCGIGGDAMALAAAGIEVKPVDLDPVRSWMAGLNVGCDAHTADATAIDIPADAIVHIDPARRDSGGRRVIRLDDMVPGPEAVRRIIACARGAAVKLAPGVDGRALADGACEFVSVGGRLLQQVLWTGAACDHAGRNTATMFDKAGGTAHSVTGESGAATTVDEPSTWIHTMDPAIERARLAHVMCARHGLDAFADPGTGLLTGAAAVRAVGLTAYRLLADLPWQAKRVRRRLRELGAGIVTVKTRGGAVHPDRLQAELRGGGDRPLTVFVQRLGPSIGCLICEDGPRDDLPADLGEASSVHPNTR